MHLGRLSRLLDPPSLSAGSITALPAGPFESGQPISLDFRLVVGKRAMAGGARLRVGLPNTGWDEPLVPMTRYWDELVEGQERVDAPFGLVNSSATLETGRRASVFLETMERMLAPNVDPAHGYWRWWITATIEGDGLDPGDVLTITYGDERFGAPLPRVQRYPESSINIAAYVDLDGSGGFEPVPGAPFWFDVISGPPSRANVVLSPTADEGAERVVRVALTDACHAPPGRGPVPSLRVINAASAAPISGLPSGLRWEVPVPVTDGVARIAVVDADGRTWGTCNTQTLEADGMRLAWGDLHGQSEYHANHSQGVDFRSAGWRKGLSCGTPEECLSFAREVALLDFAAITDQGGCLNPAWPEMQAAANNADDPGRFVAFRGYEAGVLKGHRNVIFSGDDIDPPEEPATFSMDPDSLYRHYAGRTDVILIPHHVKVWTDWRYHDPSLEPIMEVYSSWDQSESPDLSLWGKGTTPGAGAWEAIRRGYRLGMMASSDSHSGMPGRVFAGDRQRHTPFSGGLCAVWTPELTRSGVFDALRSRRCYGTTGARIQLQLEASGHPMGSDVRAWPPGQPRELKVRIVGTDEVSRVEVVRNLEVVHVHAEGGSDEVAFDWTDGSSVERDACYYLRVFQTDGHRAWSSPIWFSSAGE